MCGEHHEPTYIYNGDMFNVSFVTNSAGTAPGFTMSVVHKLGMCYFIISKHPLGVTNSHSVIAKSRYYLV